MNCPACAHANRPGAKFCEECAAPLKRLCASCSAELRPSAKFCDECGTATGAPAAPRSAPTSDTRKVVTILFADLVGSTALHERLDPESARRFMESYYAATRGAVESHGGTVTQFLGDGVKAVFGIPRVAEDDAIRAVRAAVAMQEAFRALAERVQGAVGKTGLRVAVNTGEVVANDATEIIGDPVNVAARLQEQGRDGDVVIGESTQALVAALVTLELLGSFALKGRTEAVKAYRVISLERPAGVAATPFVGRDDELARIGAVYETAVAKPAAGLVVLLGSPGLGKSRLIDELARRLGGEATVIRAHCDASGGASFAPLADALRALPDLDAAVPGNDADRARILDGVRALLAGSPASPEETFFVVRRLLSSLAATKPVVLVIDDLHWAEPLLLDLVEHLVQWGTGVPLLVLVGARPELREMRSSLTMPGGLVSEVITLAGLDAGAAMRLAANVIGAVDLPAAVAAKVLAASEGNPLFVGELVRMLVHEGALKREGDRWTAGTALAALEMPPTIHALLAARIERLRPEERIVLERAAVIGRHFSRSSVADLLARDVTDLDARLESLRRAELIERDTGWFFGEPVLRFHHVLIRDAAYRRVLKGTRAELHARFADWIEARAGDSLEHDETIGWHLEQAHQFLRELGPIDPRGLVLGERAAARLSAAGRRALARDDVSLAAGLLGRALDRLDRDDAARAELALDWCEALLAAGDVGPAIAALEELDRFAASDPRLRAWHTCFAGQLTSLTEPQGLNAAAEAVAQAARDFEALGDVAGEAKAHFVHAQAFMRLGKVGACEASLDRALAAARRAGDRRRANTVLAVAPLAALWGPSPVTRASGRCLDVVRVLRITQGAPAVEAVALACQGVLEALRGRTDASRRMVASARKMVEELGITQRLLEADVFAARIDLLDGDAAGAERGLRVAYEGLRELGLGIDAARAAALLARALLQLDRAEEAEALTHESERLAGDDLQAAIAWRGARAEALARRGETVEAVALASTAVEIAAATDALLDHADARLALATALRAAGRMRDADTEERRATELWEAKGATRLAERARPEGPRGASAEPPPEARSHATRRAHRHPGAGRATAAGARFETAIATRDVTAIEREFADPCVVVHHPTGVTYGRREQLTTWKSTVKADRAAYRREVLATLGGSLELWRHWVSVSGLKHSSVAAFGDAEFEEIVVGEVDGLGQYRRFEIFAASQLGAAIARLYERHAELLSDDVARIRATAIARAAGVMLGQPDLAATATVLAPDVEFSDLRTVGFGMLHGAEAVLETISAMMELSSDDSAQIDDVLVLEPDALVVRWTNRGTHVESGGAFERKLCQLFAFDSAGKLSRWQQFEAEHDAEALARFDALTAAPSARAWRPNAAIAAMSRFAAAFAARDVGTLDALFAESLVVVDHQNGVSYGHADEARTIGWMLRAEAARWAHTPLATLGDSHSLERVAVSGGETRGKHFDVASYELEFLVISEVDARGRFQGLEAFSAAHLGDAIARLYTRYAELLPDGPARDRANATARAVTAMVTSSVEQDFAASITPDFEAVDHRLVGHEPVGAEALQRGFAAWRELTDTVDVRVDAVFALSSHALLRRSTSTGTVRASGGAFERSLIMLSVFGPDGRITRNELFDVAQESEALARFDALVESRTAPPDSPFANAASRFVERGSRLWAARDWDGIVAAISPALRMDDRRRIMRLEIGYEDFLAQFRMLFEQPRSRWRESLVATRGERLSLHRTLFEAEITGGGALAFDEHLSLTELDADGCWITSMTFDLGDVDAAYAELDARFEAGEGAHAPVFAASQALFAAIGRRDWDAMRLAFSPDFASLDHRPLGWGSTLNSPEMWVRSQHALAELSPDFRYRRDHVRISDRCILLQMAQVGTREGGAFEIPIVIILELDDWGHFRRFELYALDQIDQAQARFAELNQARLTPAPFENAAARADRTLFHHFNARDWNGAVTCVAPELVFDERRRISRNTCGLEVWLEQFRILFDVPASRFTTNLLATRGERLSLNLHRFEGEVAHGGGPLSMEDHYALHEVDRAGRILAIVLFDQDDLGAAYAELDARFEAGEDSALGMHRTIMRAFARAAETHDWDPVLELCAPTLIEHDHRPLAILGTTRGAEAWVQNFRVLGDLAPDSRYRVDHFRSNARGFCTVGVWEGTREGGRYELPLVAVLELDGEKRIARADIYDGDQLELARARFEEIRASRPDDPLAALSKPNAASAAMMRWQAAFEIGFATDDWEPLRALSAPDMFFDDRRRLSRVSGDVDLSIASARERAVMGAQPQMHPLGTAGDRVAIHRVLWTGGPDDGQFEIEYLALMEVDASGLITTILLLDPDDLRAAQREAWARWAAIEPGVAENLRLLARAGDAFNAHDLSAYRAVIADDLLVVDQRRTGMGRLEGAESFLASVAALWELAPGSEIVFGWQWPAYASHGFVTVLRRHGMLADGGAYESEYLQLFVHARGRFTHLEVFELEDLDAALARFAELRPDPLRVPPNAASRAIDRVWELAASGETDAIRALVAEDFCFDDREKRALVRGDVDDWQRSLLFLVSEARGRIETRLVATAGERLALHHVRWREAPGEGRFEIEGLRLAEIDSAGKFRTFILFDTDQRAAASAELFERYAARGADGAPASAIELSRAINDRDLGRIRAAVPDDFVVDDRRRTGIGRLSSVDTWIASVAALYELSSDVRVDDLHQAAVAPHGRVCLSRMSGTNAEGGEFESFLVRLFLYRDEQIREIDVFEVEDLDEAIARLEELRPDALVP